MEDKKLLISVLGSDSVLGKSCLRASTWTPFFPKTVADMRARGQSRGTNIANHLTLLHPDAGLDTTFDPGHVQILRGVGAIVLDFHVVTIGASVASRDDTTLRRGQNGGCPLGQRNPCPGEPSIAVAPDGIASWCSET